MRVVYAPIRGQLYKVEPTRIDGKTVGDLRAPFPAELVSSEGYRLQGENEFPAYVELSNGAKSGIIYNPAGVRLANSKAKGIFVDGNTKMREWMIWHKKRQIEQSAEQIDKNILVGTPYEKFRVDYLEFSGSEVGRILLEGNIEIGLLSLYNSDIDSLEASGGVNIGRTLLSGGSEIGSLVFDGSRTALECLDSSVIRKKTLTNGSKLNRSFSLKISYVGGKKTIEVFD